MPPFFPYTDLLWDCSAFLKRAEAIKPALSAVSYTHLDVYKRQRLSRVKALVATALKIKPIMGSTPEGTICQLDQARGMNKALVKMVDKIVEVTENSENKILAISHCNSPKKANMLKEAIQEKMKLSDIVVLDTAGVSSMYANDGGIIVAV